MRCFESLLLLSWSEDRKSEPSTLALFLVFASCLGTRSLAMPPVAGTRSRGHNFAFLFALMLFFFLVFLFVVVFVLLPVASGSWAGGSLLLRLCLRIVFILLPVASDLWARGSLLPRLWLRAASCLLPARGPGMLGTRGCLCRKTWGYLFEP